MIEIETRQLAGIPVLHAVPAGKRECSLPCIIFYHGFTSSSLVYSYFAVALAQAGFRVVMPDAPDHGTRFTSDAQGECTASGIFCSKICRSLRRYVRLWWQKIGYQMNDLPSEARRWEE